jgi:hypothetical protein
MWLSENALANKSISSPRLQKSLACQNDINDEHDDAVNVILNNNQKHINNKKFHHQINVSEGNNYVDNKENDKLKKEDEQNDDKSDVFNKPIIENDDSDIYMFNGAGNKERTARRIVATEE